MIQKKKRPALAPATISESDGVRYLHLGTPWVQGAMRIRKPLAIELEYVQRMMVWMLLRPSEALSEGHAVQLGLGAGAITRYCHGVLRLRTTAVELNDSVIAACRAYFQVEPGRLLKVVEADAEAYVADPVNAASADVLCVDLYDHEAASPVLDSDAFYAGCHRLLRAGGAMTVNLFGRDASFERSAQRIAAAFGAEQVLSLRPTREGNTIVVALKDADWPEPDLLAMRADHIEQNAGLPARKWLKMLRALPKVPAGES
ncbi:MAG: spermidine synthase [Burkholderiales bacterium PBB1]|nr:MAG: spermidine synthase [Burkholderiales bacterium PBB1]